MGRVVPAADFGVCIGKALHHHRGMRVRCFRVPVKLQRLVDLAAVQAYSGRLAGDVSATLLDETVVQHLCRIPIFLVCGHPCGGKHIVRVFCGIFLRTHQCVCGYIVVTAEPIRIDAIQSLLGAIFLSLSLSAGYGGPSSVKKLHVPVIHPTAGRIGLLQELVYLLI